jgi:tetratricopeptide (TPR) repeat protein
MIRQYNIMLALDPNYVDALNNKGSTLGRSGQYKQAIEYFDKVKQAYSESNR